MAIASLLRTFHAYCYGSFRSSMFYHRYTLTWACILPYSSSESCFPCLQLDSTRVRFFTSDVTEECCIEVPILLTFVLKCAIAKSSVSFRVTIVDLNFHACAFRRRRHYVFRLFVRTPTDHLSDRPAWPINRAFFFWKHRMNDRTIAVLMYSDHLQNWVDVGRGLLISLFLCHFYFVQLVKFEVSGHFFFENTWKEWRKLWSDDISWPPTELIRFRSRSDDFSHFRVTLISDHIWYAWE